MGKPSKEVQARADAKRAGKRARAWWGVLYPESAPEDWQQRIREALVETLISPLHDKDVLPTGEIKKAHYHVLISFKNPVTREKAADLMEGWGCVVQRHWPKPGTPEQFKVNDFKQAARYLCHLDQPDKHRYDVADVISIGAIDYPTIVMSSADEDEMLDAIFGAMDDYFLDSYPKVVRYAKQEHPEWRPIIYRKYSRSIAEYAKGLHYEAMQSRS